MRRQLLFVVTLAAVSATLIAAQKQPKQVLLNDKKGEFKIYDVESAETSFVPGGDVQFEATGSPLKGYSKKQGVTFSALSMEGLAVRTAEGSLRLKRTLAKGSVTMDAKSAVTGGGENTSHVQAASLLLEEKEATSHLTFEQAFTYTSRLVADGLDRTITLGSPKGEFVLPLLDQTTSSNNPFLSADVKGRVQIAIDSTQRAGGGTAVWKILLTADGMTYSADDRTVKLVGNVVGDVESRPSTGQPFGFEVNADWLNVYLDEASAVKTIKSGIGSVRQKGGGQ